MAMETLDAIGLKCPKPLFEISKKMRGMSIGDELRIQADDPAFKPDIEAWCRRTGNELLELTKDDNTMTALVKKTK